MKNKILFWPGIGKDLNILKDLLDTIKEKKIEINYFEEEYDLCSLNPKKWNQVINNECDWWIGISLGASLLYYAYQYVPDNKKPKRITLINPFYSRNILSKEKNFDIKNYWDFEPIKMNKYIEHCEIIVSMHDKNINPYHSLVLSSKVNSKNNYLITINSDHTLKLNNIEKEIAKILISYNKRGYKNEKGNNNCNIYKQQ